jgi:hypothetical protein
MNTLPPLPPPWNVIRGTHYYIAAQLLADRESDQHGDYTIPLYAAPQPPAAPSLTTAAQQALSALECAAQHDVSECADAISALRAALAASAEQPIQSEPIRWLNESTGEVSPFDEGSGWIALYPAKGSEK